MPRRSAKSGFGTSRASTTASVSSATSGAPRCTAARARTTARRRRERWGGWRGTRAHPASATASASGRLAPLQPLHRHVAVGRHVVRLLGHAPFEEGQVAVALHEAPCRLLDVAEVDDVGLEELEAVAVGRRPVVDVLVDDAVEAQVREPPQEPREEVGAAHPVRAGDHLGRCGVLPGGVVEAQEADLEPAAGHGRLEGRARAVGEPLVGVEDEHPVAAGVVEGQVARRREVVVPRALEEQRPGLAGHLPGPIGGAGVHDHELVRHAPHRGEAAGEPGLLVPGDEAERQASHHSRCLSKGDARAPRRWVHGGLRPPRPPASAP